MPAQELAKDMRDPVFTKNMLVPLRILYASPIACKGDVCPTIFMKKVLAPRIRVGCARPLTSKGYVCPSTYIHKEYASTKDRNRIYASHGDKNIISGVDKGYVTLYSHIIYYLCQPHGLYKTCHP